MLANRLCFIKIAFNNDELQQLAASKLQKYLKKFFDIL